MNKQTSHGPRHGGHLPGPPLDRAFRRIIPVALVIFCLLFIPTRIFDQELFAAMNGSHGLVSDHFWLGMTTLANGCLVGMILGAFLAVNPRVAVMGLILFALSGIAVHLLKAAIDTPRPIVVMDTVHILGPMLRSGSFPSGHAAAAASAGLAVAYYAPTAAAGVGVTILALFAAVSRVFVGAHFPSDVLAGTAVSMGIFYLLLIVLAPRLEAWIPEHPHFESRVFRSFYVVELVFTLFVLSVYAGYFAESPTVAVGAAAGVLIILARARQGGPGREGRH